MFARIVYVVLIASMFGVLNAETYEECEGVEPGTYVSWSQSCAAYIYCDNEDSIMDECDEGQYFDGESCDAQENVECPLDDIEEGEADGDEVEPEATDDLAIEVQETTQSLAAETTGSTLTTEQSPTDILPFDIVNIPPVIKDTCPQVDDPNQIVLIANNNSCMDYYVCYHGHAIGMHCMDHLHFNLATGKCDFPENANCKLAIQSQLEFNKCLPHMTEFFPHPTKCNYFYYCIKGYQTLQQCPFYYGWDIEKRTCVHMAHAKCYNDAT